MSFHTPAHKFTQPAGQTLAAEIDRMQEAEQPKQLRVVLTAEQHELVQSLVLSARIDAVQAAHIEPAGSAAEREAAALREVARALEAAEALA